MFILKAKGKIQKEKLTNILLFLLKNDIIVMCFYYNLIIFV